MDAFKLSHDLNKYFDRKPANREMLPKAVGFMLGYEFDLPSGRTRSPKTFYTNQYESDVFKFLAKVNERIVFDVLAAADLAWRVWLMRYNVVYNPSVVNTGIIIATASANHLRPAEKDVLSGKESIDTLLVSICSAAIRVPTMGEE